MAVNFKAIGDSILGFERGRQGAIQRTSLRNAQATQSNQAQQRIDQTQQGLDQRAQAGQAAAFQRNIKAEHEAIETILGMVGQAETIENRTAAITDINQNPVFQEFKRAPENAQFLTNEGEWRFPGVTMEQRNGSAFAASSTNRQNQILQSNITDVNFIQEQDTALDTRLKFHRDRVTSFQKDVNAIYMEAKGADLTPGMIKEINRLVGLINKDVASVDNLKRSKKKLSTGDASVPAEGEQVVETEVPTEETAVVEEEAETTQANPEIPPGLDEAGFRQWALQNHPNLTEEQIQEGWKAYGGQSTTPPAEPSE